MTERGRDDTFDRQVRDFLAWQAAETATAPGHAEMALRISSSVGSRARRFGTWPALVWVVLALLLIAVVIGVAVGSSSLLRRPVVGVPGNGWIAFSTQPGWPELGHDTHGTGGDLYLVRDGVQPRLIVGRGAGNASNVCPAFSPDGLTLVYGHRAGSGRALVFLRVSPDGVVSVMGRLEVPGDGNVPCPRWSKDGTRLAYLIDDSRTFVENPEQRQATLVIRGLDGATLSPRAGDPTAEDLKRLGYVHNPPLLSPSGAWTVLDDGLGIVVQQTDGTVTRRPMSGQQFGALLGYPRGFELSPYSIPAWSPDSRYVVLMGDVSGIDFALVTVSIDAPFAAQVLAPLVRVNSSSGASFPGRNDVSWQPVFP